MEKLKYIETRLSLGNNQATLLTIQLTGGGASQTFKRDDSMDLIIEKLRDLIKNLEEGCKARENKSSLERP